LAMIAPTSAATLVPAADRASTRGRYREYARMDVIFFDYLKRKWCRGQCHAFVWNIGDTPIQSHAVIHMYDIRGHKCRLDKSRVSMCERLIKTLIAASYGNTNFQSRRQAVVSRTDTLEAHGVPWLWSRIMRRHSHPWPSAAVGFRTL